MLAEIQEHVSAFCSHCSCSALPLSGVSKRGETLRGDEIMPLFSGWLLGSRVALGHCGTSGGHLWEPSLCTLVASSRVCFVQGGSIHRMGLILKLAVQGFVCVPSEILPLLHKAQIGLRNIVIPAPLFLRSGAALVCSQSSPKCTDLTEWREM